MVWTKEKPTVSGHYWYKVPKSRIFPEGLIDILLFDTKESYMPIMIVGSDEGFDWDRMNQYGEVEYAGPIKEPTVEPEEVPDDHGDWQCAAYVARKKGGNNAT